jgi:hypothetical protein
MTAELTLVRNTRTLTVIRKPPGQMLIEKSATRQIIIDRGGLPGPAGPAGPQGELPPVIKGGFF